MDDKVRLGSDSWHYQSLAVNLCYGHGFKVGAAEDYSLYRFRHKSRANVYYDSDCRHVSYYEAFNRGADYDFYRNPGYPFFVALIYCVGGVHPVYVKVVQFVLLAFSLSALPFMGWRFWGGGGFVSGFASALVVLFGVNWLVLAPTKIMTESLTVFSLLCWAVMCIHWEGNPSRKRTFAFGLISAAMILVKGTTIFIPLILIWVMFYRWGSKALQLALVFGVGLILPLCIWSAYASIKSGETVFITTKSDNILLDSNNEDVIKTGRWMPRWRKKPNASPDRYMYLRMSDSSLPTSVKVLLFWSENIDKLPITLLKKFESGFRPYLLVWGLCLLYYASATVGFLNLKNPPIFPFIYLTNITVLTLLTSGIPRLVGPFIVYLMLPATYLIFTVVFRAYSGLKSGLQY